MRLFTPTEHKRLNEATGFVLLAIGLVLWLSLVSYRLHDPSWNTAGTARPANLIGYAGSYIADILLQSLGLAAFVLPVLSILLAWKWLRSKAVEAPLAKITGTTLFVMATGTALSLSPSWRLFDGAILPGGAAGLLLAEYLRDGLNMTGAALVTATILIVSIYLVSSFTMEKLALWLARPARALEQMGERWRNWLAARTRRKRDKSAAKLAEKLAEQRAAKIEVGIKPIESIEPRVRKTAAPVEEEESAVLEEIPICPLDEEPVLHTPAPEPLPRVMAAPPPAPVATQHVFELPRTDLLNEPPGRNPFDEQELKEIAVRVKSKFEEFNVLGSVVQINPGPVVTTFEFKPEAGIKYSRMTTLTEDLCLGLQAESILIERIPGKPTVGIEVPNTKREVISLRQVLESDEFQNSPSHLTISLGKDINGRIRIAALESMPHLLIAGSTGSGKSVMINSMIMSILYKSTPDEVRLIMVDPKRLELGLYEGIPHLLTPVITDPKKATNALRNAVLEMERRLRLLAEQGVRNVEQFNKKIHRLQ
ncbi:MAG: DNA translocase FtsK 4TM domain-containing protein, partial [Bryobacteraceae bacterium]